MAGKGSRKDLKIQKAGLFLERFVYDILKYTLPLCGLPEEKLKCKERIKNAYAEGNIIPAGVTVVNIALRTRDEWKSMFESRLKSSGFDTFEKIELYLKTFFTISSEFRNGITIAKIRISLAVYNEMILFLNSKEIEFDFEELIILWRKHFFDFISQITSQKEANELIKRFFARDNTHQKYRKWFNAFINQFAVPYGSRTDISEIYEQRTKELSLAQNEGREEMEKMIAHFSPAELDAVLPPGFESQAVLPGDRESPEPQGIGSQAVLPGDRESPEQPEISAESGASEEDEDATGQSAELRVPLGFVPLCAIRDDDESPDQPESPGNSNIRRREKRPRRRSALSTDARQNTSKGQGIEDKFGQMSLRSQQDQ